MENIEFQNPYFISKNMYPQSSDDITAIWGRHMVMNLASGYGIVGTTYTSPDYLTFINLQLTKIYQFPPFVQIMYKGRNSGSGFMLNQFSTNRYAKDILYCINGDCLVVANGPLTHSYEYDVYFRLHGV